MNDHEAQIRKLAEQACGEVRCRYPAPSHAHDDSDCRACALRARITVALETAYRLGQEAERLERAKANRHKHRWITDEDGCIHDCICGKPWPVKALADGKE